ncbi:hypothetical protein [Methylibium sp.]|uniref:hypothetical protein n=1 Tax=Methylibium sp. TaxID=2067992 RepID=UPI0025EC7518|nr:hypothetical protein [Methylibium sp.]
MIDVSNDREVAYVVHLTRVLRWRLEQEPHVRWCGGIERSSRSALKAGEAVARIKKRHVKPVTRLPTKNVWQLLCWDFIVAKSSLSKTASGLAFPSLRRTNMKSIHSLSTKSCGRPVDD